MASSLLAVLNQVLASRNLLPVRDGNQLAQRLADHPSKVFTYDGVERGMLTKRDKKKNTALKKSPCAKEQHLMR